MRRSWRRFAPAGRQSRAHLRRTLVALLVPAFVASGLAGSVPAAAAAVPTAAAGEVDCRRVMQGQSMDIQATFHETQYVEEYSGGGAPIISGRKTRTWKQGKVLLRAATCQSPTGWMMLDPASVESEMLRLYLVRKELHYDGRAGRGWAVITKRVNHKSIVMDSFVCDKIPFWGFIEETTGLPWPGSKAVSFGLWLSSKAASTGDDTVCKKTGRVKGKITFTARGGLASISGKSTKVITSSTVVTGKKLVVERWTSVSKG